MQKYTWQRHTTFTCNVRLWSSNQGFHFDSTIKILSPRYLEGNPRCPIEGFKKPPHQSGWTLIRTHQKTTSTRNRRLCASSEPNRALPTQMGQNWRHHRIPPIWSICSKSWWFGKSYFTQQKFSQKVCPRQEPKNNKDYTGCLLV